MNRIFISKHILRREKMYWIFLLFIIHLNTIVSNNQSALPWDHNGYHGLELNLIGQFLPFDPVILEAGAHRGEDTTNFIRRWPTATVYAFEPCPAYFTELRQKTSDYKNIHIFPIGLFSKTGHYTFNVSKNWDGASSLLEDNHLSNGLNYEDHAIEVYCENLDEWAQKNNVSHIDYMWLDMEGAELYMLNSAPTILNTVRVISCEINFLEFRKGMTIFQDLHDFLLKNNFTLYKIWGSPVGQATGIYVKNLNI